MTASATPAATCSSSRSQSAFATASVRSTRSPVWAETSSRSCSPTGARSAAPAPSPEALARWKHPVRGFVSPGEFVPLAEQTGLVSDLGRWVLAEACSRLADWHRRFPSHRSLTVSVNISGRHLEELCLVDDVRDVLALTRLAPEHLVLEITESVLMANTEESVDLLGRLDELGIGLAIDDFGTGYSSLAYPDRFP